ncbi:MAG TPA: protein kinase [Bryobacteraceae bacterium]
MNGQPELKAQRWEKVERLLLSASEKSPAERQQFLAEQCGNDHALRLEVESLLAARSQAGTFLETAALEEAGRALAREQTRHAAGDEVGPYRLVSQLGAGGMGEVWRALDSRVGRHVAIKFCSEHFTERFGREARAIAALSHPNICQLYDVGLDYLVMELVDGEPPAGPLPLQTALDYARQVANALEAAHDKGIIHRDLKPGNIRVRPDGTVKVLDFGLAKVLEVATPASQDSATIAKSETQAGTILGTPGYMSPEQIRGQCVDKRTDIWAFSVLLCELLTGKTPFERATVSDMQAAVLTAGPDLDSIPVQVRRLVRKCLEKNPKNRLRDIGDAWELLGSPAPAAEATSRWMSRTGWIIAGVLAAAVAIVGWVRFPSRNPEDKRLMRFDVDLGADISIELAGSANVAMSPDGSRLAFISRGQLFVQNFNDPQLGRIASVQGANTPFFSPDGQWIAFFAPGRLRKVPAAGGAAIDICRTNAFSVGGAWAPDGTIVAALSPSGPLFRIPSGGGSPQPLTQLDRARGEVTHRLPQALPGGRAVIFTSSNSTFDLDDSDIDVVTLADGRRKNLVHGGTFGRYLPSGHLTYINRGVLYAMPFDITRLEPSGEAVPVLHDIVYSPVFGSAQVDVSASGTLVYRMGSVTAGDVTIQKIDRSGAQESLIAKPGMYFAARISPDGERVVLVSRQNGAVTLSMYDRRSDIMTPLMLTDAVSRSQGAPFAIWTPDGRFIVLRGKGGMYWMRADSAGEPRALTVSDQFQTPSSFSPDGKTLAYYESPIGSGAGGAQIWTVSVESDGSQLRAHDPRRFFQSSTSEYHPTFSADGRWLAYTSAESGPLEIYVRSWPDTGRKWQVSSNGGFCPLFARRGSELFYVNSDGQIMVVSYRAIKEAFIPERPRLWTGKPIALLGTILWSYDTMPDGSGIAGLILPEGPRQRYARNHVIVLQNFLDHLKRIVPTK